MATPAVFHYTPILAHGEEDHTEFEKLEGPEFSGVKLDANGWLQVPSAALTRLSHEAIHRITHLFRSAHLKQLVEVAKSPASSSNDRFVVRELLTNACASVEDSWRLPTCQDTGTAIVHGYKGRKVTFVEGDIDDEEALSRGVYDAYTQDALRYSQVAVANGCGDSLGRETNTGCNLPAQIDIAAAGRHLCPEKEYRFLFLAKGGGSGNKTFLFQDPPAKVIGAGREGLLAYFASKLPLLGTSACPPYHLAVVIGGTSAEANLKTVKLASARYLDDLPTVSDGLGTAFRDLQLEADLLDVCKKTRIGAQFGGNSFALDVRVIRLPRHAASCPVGLGVSCSADRQIKAKITAEGVFVEKLEAEPSKFIASCGGCELATRELPAATHCIDLNRPWAETLDQLRQNCHAGDRVSLCGPVIVARDAAHARFRAALNATGKLPDYLRNHIVCYAGPAKKPVNGKPVGSFGPTTAGRMDVYMPVFQKEGACLVTLAKGDRSQMVKDSCKQYGGLYLSGIGGVAASMSRDCVESIECVEFEDLGMEAVWRIVVKDFPAFVMIDSNGDDLFSKTKC